MVPDSKHTLHIHVFRNVPEIKQTDPPVCGVPVGPASDLFRNEAGSLLRSECIETPVLVSNSPGPPITVELIQDSLSFLFWALAARDGAHGQRQRRGSAFL